MALNLNKNLKLYYSIKEVAEMFDLNESTLRYWEQHREQTARYMEYNNRGEGAKTAGRVAWSRQLTKKEAEKITLATVMGGWMPQQ